MANRATAHDAWSTPVNVGPTINSTAWEHDPSISSDGLDLYFTSRRSGGQGTDDLWYAKRATMNDPWETPVNLGAIINSQNHDMDPSLSKDGQELYFCSDRPNGHGNYDIWITTQQTSERNPKGYWGTPTNLGLNVNTSYSDHSPSISADGLVLFFCSSRPGGNGSSDLWMTTRPTTDDSWGEPVNLGATINSSASEDDPCISGDGLWLLFNLPTGRDNIWQAPVVPIVDLNGDGIVDSADMCIMVDHWGTDEPLCDIGPMPWGDGIVDVEDLKVLAERLFEEFPPAQ
jgi:Tol biopolymer transport system component